MPVQTRSMTKKSHQPKKTPSNRRKRRRRKDESTTSKSKKAVRTPRRKRNYSASKNESEPVSNERPKKRRRLQKKPKQPEVTDQKDPEVNLDMFTFGKPVVATTTLKKKTETGIDVLELARIEKMQEMERQLYENGGHKIIVGCDEAGRGPLAGPVVAAACYIPLDLKIPQIADSKQLTESQREEIYKVLTTNDRVVYGVSVVSHTMIDEINILQAALLGMRNSTFELNEKLKAKNQKTVDYVLVDGNRDPRFEESGLSVQSETVVKGDDKVYCIAAASVIAKVTRDRLMVEYDKRFPIYKFAQHKGYPTPQHRQLVIKHGPCVIHRRSFQPVKTIVGWERPKKPKKAKKKKEPKSKKKDDDEEMKGDE